IHHYALELIGIHKHWRQSIRELGVDANAIETAVEYSEGVRDDTVQIAANQLGRGKSRELRELVHQRLDRLHLFRDHRSTFVDDAEDFGRRREPLDLTANPFRRKRDRCKRITDFVRDTPGYLAPRRGFLGPQQIARVLEYRDEGGSPRLLDCRDRYRQVQR